MDKRFEKIYEIAEREGWSVCHEITSDNIVQFEFSQYSPADQDFNFCIDAENDNDVDYFVHNVAEAVYSYWKSFDVSEQTYIWLDQFGHGSNGAPDDMKEVYEDMEACETMVHDLWLALEGREKPTEEKPEQYVYEVFESDAWHTRDSMTHKATYLSLEEAVDAIMEHGEFDEDEDLDYVRKYLFEYHQTPETGDVNYDISVVEIGTWE